MRAYQGCLLDLCLMFSFPWPFVRWLYFKVGLKYPLLVCILSTIMFLVGFSVHICTLSLLYYVRGAIDRRFKESQLVLLWLEDYRKGASVEDLVRRCKLDDVDSIYFISQFKYVKTMRLSELEDLERQD